MSYLTIDAICQQLDEPVSAGEAHGLATALLCVDDRTDAAVWFSELTQETATINDEQKQMLFILFEQTRELLTGDDFSFDLFLPDDDASLQERAEALKSWCQGFIYGLGLNYQSQQLPAESREILKDIIEFTKLDSDAEGEEDEAALMEISEYIKVSVQLLKEELNS